MKIVRPALIAALLIAHSPVQAASFNCTKGHSFTEKMICSDTALSRLDDTLGQLYWKARRRAPDRRGFIADSDSKWAWREANCRDAACLGTWYATRIDELQQLLASLPTGAPPALAQPLEPADALKPALKPALPERSRKPSVPASPTVETAMRQCTAANPGIAIGEQCPSVIKQNDGRWKYRPHGGDWFCGIAMLERS